MYPSTSDGAVAGHNDQNRRQTSGILPLALVTGRWGLREDLVVVMAQSIHTLGVALAERLRQDRSTSRPRLNAVESKGALKRGARV